GRQIAGESHLLRESQLAAELFTIAPMAAIPGDDAFEWLAQLPQRAQQQIDSFSANDLAGEKNEISMAESAERMPARAASHWHMKVDSVWIESIADQLPFGKARIGYQRRALLG